MQKFHRFSVARKDHRDYNLLDRASRPQAVLLMISLGYLAPHEV
jgi:hypothetical protein